jgi:guanylate kinase
VTSRKRPFWPNTPELSGRLVVVSGPSGSGKTTIIRRLLEETDIEFSVSATTRAPRPGEIDGTDYFFMSEPEFKKLIAEDGLLEWATYNGNYYGTPVVPIDVALSTGRDMLLDIELLGAQQVREHRPDAVLIFVAPPSIADLESRLRGRGDTTEEDIQGRLRIAHGQLEEAPGLFDHIVVNDDVERATEEIKNLVISDR